MAPKLIIAHRLALTEQKVHRDVLAVMKDKHAELNEGKIKMVEDVFVTFLRNWLKNHIMGSDIPTYGPGTAIKAK